MAGTSTLSAGFSLTGTLTLTLKSTSKHHFFKAHDRHSRSYWFWFDEQSCSLKYYKNKDTYLSKVNEPVGCIDLRYAKVTPGIASGDNSKQFLISLKRDSSTQQLFLLSAASDQEALSWIEKLQEKRSEYIKRSSAIEDNAQEQERDRRTFRPPNTQPVSLLATSQDVNSSPPSVRKIINSRLSGSSGDRPMVSVDTVLSPLSPSLVQDSERPLDPEQRQCLELETHLLEARGETDNLKRQMLRMSASLESKEREVTELKSEVAQLKEELARLHKPASDLQLENDSLKNILDQYRRSLKTLDEEINLHRLNEAEHDKRLSAEKLKLGEREAELLRVKASYIQLFSDKFKPSVQGDDEDLIDESSNNELTALLAQESGGQVSGGKEPFEDQYGDIHDWTSGVTTQLYLCRQLYLHYTLSEEDKLAEDWLDYLSTASKGRGKSKLELPPAPGDRSKKRVLRNLLRRGVPLQFRNKVWTGLIQKLVGKTRDVRDEAAGKDTSYYQSLLKAKNSSVCEKQIKLDLYRTLPSNTHFQRDGSGAAKLENVLLAYSLHNKNVGYCQGMNMLAAIGLLFLDEETNFWFMVAIVDKLMPQHYFSPGLLAPQADQAVLRELVANLLPRLHNHLQRYSIDVTLVTFNWFLTLFVDALPTETVLRILDCFLMEGPKVLFRMSLGILKINERKILSLTDPVALFQFLKEVARHTFNIEAVFQAAFVDLNPFPNRSHLSSRHAVHFAVAHSAWTERERARETLKSQVKSVLPSVQTTDKRRIILETGCCVRDELWMTATEDQATLLFVLKQSVEEPLQVSLPQAGSRVICMCDMSWAGLVLLGTLDFYVHAVSSTDQTHLWCIKLNDSVLNLVAHESSSSLYAALADGCIAVCQNTSSSAPIDEPLFVRIGSNASVQAMVLSEGRRELWCGCAKAVTVISSKSLEAVQSVSMPDNVGKVYRMEKGTRGVWISFRKTTIVCLYDTDFYIQLLTIDYATLLSSTQQLSRTDQEQRITALLSIGESLCVGTGIGSVHLFSVAAAVANPAQHVRALAARVAETVTEFRARKGSGGLLTSAGEELQAGLPDRRRPSLFAHTVRYGRYKKGNSSAGVYKLVYQESLQAPYLSLTEPVRLLLSLREGFVSCVASPSDWCNALQHWTQANSDKWECVSLLQKLKDSS